MGKINILGFDVANLIAAGEVVDRPCSVVKELLENAVDSGADTITVEIRNGGVSHIRVSDNGCGIESDDMPVAVLRHATSKIKDADDLESISTLGFRGEALAAIAAVTRLEIFSRPKHCENGSYLLCEGGEIVDMREAGCVAGTTVIANDLFYNVPARRKFLKRDATEGAKITEIVEKVALSVPDISIKYIYDGQLRFMTQGDGSLKNAIYSIFGKKTASRLIEVDRTENGVRTSGYVSDCDLNFSKRSEEIFFVNGRYIKSPLLMASLERAYISKIPSDKFPMCVLNIDVATAAVDVNVHPTKLEIKFSNERVVSEAVHFAVLTALNSSSARPEMKLGNVYAGENEFFVQGNKVAKVLNAFVPVEKDKKDIAVQASLPSVDEYSKKAFKTGAVDDKSIKQVNSATVVNDKSKISQEPKTIYSVENGVSSILAGYDLPDFSSFTAESKSSVNSEHEDSDQNTNSQSAQQAQINQNVKAETDESRPSHPDSGSKLPRHTIIGEAYNCYVIVELDDRLLLIDKHAAHERILFDALCERRKSKEKEAQLLLAPVEMHLVEDEILCLAEYADDIRSVGFDFNIDTAKRQVMITRIPTEISPAVAPDMLSTMLARLIEGTGTVESTENEFFEKALFQAACKAAIKGGRHYGIDHIKWIVSKLLKAPGEDGKVIKTCPHGRPVAFEIKKSSIERQFSRLE